MHDNAYAQDLQVLNACITPGSYNIIGIITDILRDNPYSKQFRSLGQVENHKDYKLILNLDQRLD
jgi:hypothetical protein